MSAACHVCGVEIADADPNEVRAGIALCDECREHEASTDERLREGAERMLGRKLP